MVKECIHHCPASGGPWCAPTESEAVTGEGFRRAGSPEWDWMDGGTSAGRAPFTVRRGVRLDEICVAGGVIGPFRQAIFLAGCLSHHGGCACHRDGEMRIAGVVGIMFV